MSNIRSAPVKAQDRTRTDTLGRRELIAWLGAPRRRRTQQRLARILGINQGAVSEWVRGLARPTVAKALFLWKLCGISVESWCTERDQTWIARAEFEAHKLAAEPDVESAEERKKRLAARQLSMPFLEKTGTS